MYFRRLKVSLLTIALLLTAVSLTAALDTGDSLPPFSVVSGDGKILIDMDLIGKHTFLFYEDRSKMDMNEGLKSFLMAQGYSDEEVLFIVVADCSKAGVFKRVWQTQLEDASRKSGSTIYGDWNGRMKDSFRAADKTSSFYIIDPAGTVRYFREGVVPESEFQEINGIVSP